MKTKIFSLLAAAVLTVSMTGCSDDPDYPVNGDAVGRLSLEDLGVTVSTDETELSRADGDIDTSAYLVTITDNEGTVRYESTMADRQEVIVLPVGQNYTVSIRSHEVQNAEWEKPYYTGTKQFDIKENEITSIGTVVCRFSNVRVSVRYSEKLHRMMEDNCVVTITCSETNTSLEYAKSESRSGYFKALEGSTTLVAEFRGTVNGTNVNLRRAFTDIAAGQHRIITFDVKDIDSEVPDEMGYIDLGGEGQGQKVGEGLYLVSSVTNVDVNGNIDTDEESGDNKRPGDGEDIKDPDDPNPPIPSTEYVTFATTMKFGEPQPTAGADGIVTISVNSDTDCPSNTIQNLKVKIIPGGDEFRSALEDVNMPLEFDLANVPDDQLAIFTGFKFPVNDGVKGQTKIEFKIIDFVPLLNAYPGNHSFEISVTDAYSHTETRTLIFIGKQ